VRADRTVREVQALAYFAVRQAFGRQMRDL
jgi:hypothetical protein